MNTWYVWDKDIAIFNRYWSNTQKTLNNTHFVSCEIYWWKLRLRPYIDLYWEILSIQSKRNRLLGDSMLNGISRISWYIVLEGSIIVGSQINYTSFTVYCIHTIFKTISNFCVHSSIINITWLKIRRDRFLVQSGSGLVSRNCLYVISLPCRME